MTDDDDEIVIRLREFKLTPNVEHYVQTLSDNGTEETFQGRQS